MLLVDELYRSGATAALVAKELMGAGAGAVYFLAMTKTRTAHDEGVYRWFPIARLPAGVRNRIDTMVEKGFQILVGDANGADKAIQRYLADKSYANVLVHCMENHCRNNVGTWPTFQVAAPQALAALTTTRSRTRRWRIPPITA